MSDRRFLVQWRKWLIRLVSLIELDQLMQFPFIPIRPSCDTISQHHAQRA